MASISSLLKAAEATRKKQQAYEDEVMAFNWSNSSKTPDEWSEYQDYLSQRQQQSSDPSEELSYAKRLKTVEDGFVSAEIEREAIRVLEGTGTKQDQLVKVSQLLERAIERGNYDLAQNLYKQGLTLQEQIATQQEAGQRVAAAMATNGVKDLKKLVSQLEKGTGDENGLVVIGDNAYKSLYRVSQELKAAGDSTAGLFTDAYLTTQAIQELVIDAYNSATTQDAVDYLENNLRPVIDGSKKYSVAGKSLTANEIELGYRSALANNPIYSVTTGVGADGSNTFSLTKNKVEDFMWVYNDDGTYEAMAVQTRKTNESLGTRYDDKGNKIVTKYDEYGQVVKGTESNETQSIENRLALLGYAVQQGEDGKIILTDRDGRIYTDAAIENGKVRFIGDPNEYSQGAAGIYEINLFDQENFGALGSLGAGTKRAVAPDETSDFGYTSEFGGQFGATTQAGKNAIMGIAGVSQYSTPRFNIDQVVERLQVKDFATPRISSLDGGVGGNFVAGTSSLLQSAGTTRNYLAELNRKEEQRKAAERAALTSQALSLPNTPNINQTPVRNIASSGAPVRQLKVNAAPTTQKISSVGVVQPNRTITGVDNSKQYKGKLTVR